MTRRKLFLRVYSQADWTAHLLFATCIAVTLNFLEVVSQLFARAQSETYTVDGVQFTFTACYFGPPPAFYPRFIVVVAMLLATPAAFKRTVACRFTSSVGLAAAMASYVFWWLSSYRTFRNFEELADIRVWNDPEVKEFAYLYAGTPADLAIALSIAVCLVMMLDRLCGGEATSV